MPADPFWLALLRISVRRLACGLVLLGCTDKSTANGNAAEEIAVMRKPEPQFVELRREMRQGQRRGAGCVFRGTSYLPPPGQDTGIAGGHPHSERTLSTDP